MFVTENTFGGYTGVAGHFKHDGETSFIVMAASLEDLAIAAKLFGCQKVREESCKRSIIFAADKIPQTPRVHNLTYYRPPDGKSATKKGNKPKKK